MGFDRDGCYAPSRRVSLGYIYQLFLPMYFLFFILTLFYRICLYNESLKRLVHTIRFFNLYYEFLRCAHVVDEEL